MKTNKKVKSSLKLPHTHRLERIGRSMERIRHGMESISRKKQTSQSIDASRWVRTVPALCANAARAYACLL